MEQQQVFEGSEKRVEIKFVTYADQENSSNFRGLRSLTRDQIDDILDCACCTIVSAGNNEHLDHYVLSESSLFVYSDTFILKTCGNTKLLAAIPKLLQFASMHMLQPTYVQYSRASYLFPELQPAPYGSFDAECHYLNTIFQNWTQTTQPFITVLGDASQGLQWHVYRASSPQPPSQVSHAYSHLSTMSPLDGGAYNMKPPRTTLELCMTHLNPGKARLFYQVDESLTGRAVTRTTGIQAFVEKVQKVLGANTILIDEHLFDPCGYSANVLLDNTFITIHVTPEPGQSYASVEIYAPSADMDVFDVRGLIPSIVEVWGASQTTVNYVNPSVTCDGCANSEMNKMVNAGNVKREVEEKLCGLGIFEEAVVEGYCGGGWLGGVVVQSGVQVDSSEQFSSPPGSPAVVGDEVLESPH